jgi:uncharacterized protein YdhG (YjbR/CyaY superfamily)
MTKGSPIDDYLSGAEEEQRAALEVLRRTVAQMVPEATEGISYGMPAFQYRGRPLVRFAAFKKHCSLFPMGHTVLEGRRRGRSLQNSEGNFAVHA